MDSDAILGLSQAYQQIAEEGWFDMIVIGSGDGTPINRAFRGSVSRHVVAHAAATVVVAH